MSNKGKSFKELSNGQELDYSDIDSKSITEKLEKVFEWKEETKNRKDENDE